MPSESITALLKVLSIGFFVFSVFFLAGVLCSLYEERRRKKLLFLTVYYVMLLTAYVPPNYQPAMLRHCPCTGYLAPAFLINQYFLTLSSSTFINPMKEFLSYKHLYHVSDRDIMMLQKKLHLSVEVD